MIAAIVTGMAGFHPHFSTGTVETRSRLTAHSEWLALIDVPVFGGAVDIKHISTTETQLVNRTGQTLHWRAAFPETARLLSVDGQAVVGQPIENTATGAIESFVMVTVDPGQSRTVRIV